ncbi:hypothetical protein ACIQWB_35220 [Streptomyces olivaceus]|uniref:hypothetical protein n=1 Tax=Streptomyces olivaceus TaxID=47716 RepID=UPI00380D2A01
MAVDPVDGDGRPVPQWGRDVVARLSPAEIVAAQRKGHLTAYLRGEDVVSEQAPQRPEQYTADQVAGLSRVELLAAHKAGHLVEWMNSPAGQRAGGTEL